MPLVEPPLVITHKVLVSQLFDSTHIPLASFPLVARIINALEIRNHTAFTALARRIVCSTECGECKADYGK